MPSLAGGTEVGHLALVDDTNLVEKVVEVLASLVNGDNRRHPAQISGDAKCLHELERGRRTAIISAGATKQTLKK